MFFVLKISKYHNNLCYLVKHFIERWVRRSCLTMIEKTRISNRIDKNRTDKNVCSTDYLLATRGDHPSTSLREGEQNRTLRVAPTRNNPLIHMGEWCQEHRAFDLPLLLFYQCLFYIICDLFASFD